MDEEGFFISIYFLNRDFMIFLNFFRDAFPQLRFFVRAAMWFAPLVVLDASMWPPLTPEKILGWGGVESAKVKKKKDKNFSFDSFLLSAPSPPDLKGRQKKKKGSPNVARSCTSPIGC